MKCHHAWLSRLGSEGGSSVQGPEDCREGQAPVLVLQTEICGCEVPFTSISRYPPASLIPLGEMDVAGETIRPLRGDIEDRGGQDHVVLSWKLLAGWQWPCPEPSSLLSFALVIFPEALVTQTISQHVSLQGGTHFLAPGAPARQ